MERRATIAAAVLLAYCSRASALNPSLDINQYAHNAWTVRDGFFKGYVVAMAQTADGYLWLGTEFGLLRFDGVRYVPFQPPEGEHLPGGVIRSLLVGRDGRLWIGTFDGLASWKDGKLTHYPELAGQDALALLEDREGTMWVGGAGPTKKLCAIQSGGTHCYGEDGSLGRGISCLYQDSRGSLWAAGSAGFWRWKPDPPKFYPVSGGVRSLTESENGSQLIATGSGIRQLVDGNMEAYRLGGAGRPFSPSKLLRDHNGGLWIGTLDRGLLHVHEGRTDVFSRSDGLSGDEVNRLFEDREGNIWVATVDGLDRFRDFAIPTISVKQGLSNAVIWSALAATDGSIWLGSKDGLNRWNNGQITIYRRRNGLLDDNVESLFQDDRGRIWVSTNRGISYLENGRFIPVSGVPGGSMYSMTGDSVGNLWISHDDQGLFHLLWGSVVERIPWAKFGRQYAAIALANDFQHGLWLGFWRGGGVMYFKDGQIRASYSRADGLGGGRVETLQLAPDGTLWVGTEGGLSRVKDGRVTTLTSKNGLPCDTVHWVTEDNDRSLWLYTACGLVRIAGTELDAWATDSKRTVQVTVFDSSDGVRSHSGITGYSPLVTKSADGKLWFLPWDGVSVIDPRRLPVNKLPPPVHIEQITADRKTYDTTSNLRLPALTRDLEVDYTALSLVAPEKNRFKYKLEGRDPDWKDVGNERKAFYNDLPPRNYRFRVKACNNSGVWNEAGASFDFSIDPRYYQTTWFHVSCVAAFLAFLAGLYRLRLLYLTKQFNARLEGRVSERTRVARDLHDTLLQSFQGVLLKFSALKYLIPTRPDEAVEKLERIIEQARTAITEGRVAVEGLRSSVVVTNDLARAITAFGEGLASDQNGRQAPDFRVVVEGACREVVPLVRDELYRIASEALRNAFRHADARRVEVDIHYDARQLRMRVRDDGKGIDPQVLAAGARSGHHGLPGMRERAELVGGKLAVWSESDSGTEIELTVPAAIAYAHRLRQGAGNQSGRAR